MDDGAGGRDLGVEELDGAGAGGTKQGLAASLDDGAGADPVLVEQAGHGEGVGQLAGALDEEVAAFGLIDLNLLAVLTGILITHGGKAWYLDRVQLLFAQMKDRNPEYASWDY